MTLRLHWVLLPLLAVSGCGRDAAETTLPGNADSGVGPSYNDAQPRPPLPGADSGLQSPPPPPGIDGGPQPPPPGVDARPQPPPPPGVDGGPQPPPSDAGTQPPPMGQGPKPCTSAAECLQPQACPPGAIGCTCAQIQGGSFCVPTCSTNGDCPQVGTALVCGPGSVCVPAS